MTDTFTTCVTGATGFIGGHVARLLAERGHTVRITYRASARLGGLGELEIDPVKADVLDRAGMRRAVRGCDVVFHSAGYVNSRPVERVWRLNALSPRIVVDIPFSQLGDFVFHCHILEHEDGGMMAKIRVVAGP